MGGDGAGAGSSAHPDRLGDAGGQLITAGPDLGAVKDGGAGDLAYAVHDAPRLSAPAVLALPVTHREASA
ncbi:hypothetical protein [Kitasatospora sp. NPDC086791]|uniref:hypothetical protein n=1 Tax=Kitasatospora sp. NPDC086791 TaxID=3155178 RepID=UPI0034310A41